MSLCLGRCLKPLPSIDNYRGVAVFILAHCLCIGRLSPSRRGTDRADFRMSESHETIRGGERVLICRARPEHSALYADFIHDVSAEDLRLRFFRECYRAHRHGNR